MFKQISRMMMTLSLCLIATASFAEETVEVTGRACKEFTSLAKMSPTQATALQSFYSSPREVKLSEFEFKDGMNSTASAYITGVKQVINECRQNCHGLLGTNGRRFSCEGLGRANANQIHILVRDNSILLDSAKALRPSLVAEAENDEDNIEAPDSGRTDAEAGEDAVQETNTPVAKAPADTPAYKNHYIRRADEPREALIEL